MLFVYPCTLTACACFTNPFEKYATDEIQASVKSPLSLCRRIDRSYLIARLTWQRHMTRRLDQRSIHSKCTRQAWFAFEIMRCWQCWRLAVDLRHLDTAYYDMAQPWFTHQLADLSCLRNAHVSKRFSCERKELVTRRVRSLGTCVFNCRWRGFMVRLLSRVCRYVNGQGALQIICHRNHLNT